MKRLIIVGMIILLSFILQSTLFQFLEIGQVAPNLLLIITVSFALIRGKTEGALIGFCCGLLIDIFFVKILGFYSLLYMYIGFFNGFIYQSFYRESLLVPTLMILISDFFYGFSVYLVSFLMRGKLNMGYYMYRLILPEIIYTSILMLFLYRVILYVNSKLEANEKGGA